MDAHMDLSLVDRSWGELLGVDPTGSAGVHVVVDPPWLQDYNGSFVLHFPDRCLVTTPAHREAHVRRAIADRGPHDVFDAAFAPALGEPGWVVVGPSWHHYIDRDRFRTPVDGRARPLGPRDEGAVARLRGAVGDGDWAEGGFGPDVEVLWGIEEDGEFVAAGNLTEWLGRRADIGVVTHPAHRGRGLAVAITAAMTQAALEEHPIVSYRALFGNDASLRVAAKLGFVRHGANLAVRPPRQAKPLTSP